MFQRDRLADLIQEVRCAGPAPFTLESLAEWLETRDPGERYDLYVIGECLWGVYTKAKGGKRLGFDYCVDKHVMTVVCSEWPFSFYQIASGYEEGVVAKSGWTMGKALVRTRTAIAARAS